MYIIKALQLLRPGSQWYLDGYTYEDLEWLDETQDKPTKEEVEAKINEIEEEWNNTQYQRDRAPLYPNLADFVDAYYWAQKGDTSKMDTYISKCDEVKNQYPKPQN
jgi:hypothetical protein